MTWLERYLAVEKVWLDMPDDPQSGSVEDVVMASLLDALDDLHAQLTPDEVGRLRCRGIWDSDRKQWRKP